MHFVSTPSIPSLKETDECPFASWLFVIMQFLLSFTFKCFFKIFFLVYLPSMDYFNFQLFEVVLDSLLFIFILILMRQYTLQRFSLLDLLIYSITKIMVKFGWVLPVLLKKKMFSVSCVFCKCQFGQSNC